MLETGVAGMILGLGLIGLAGYFIWMKRPYSRLLRAAGVEVVETYQGWRKGESWEVAVSVGARGERHLVQATDLGRFMFKRAMGRFYESEKAKAMAIEDLTAVAVGESLMYEEPEDFVRQKSTLSKKLKDDFSSSRREILSKAEEILSPVVALRAKESARLLKQS